MTIDRNPVFLADELWRALTKALHRVSERPHHAVLEREATDPLGLDAETLNRLAAAAGWPPLIEEPIKGKDARTLAVSDPDGLDPPEMCTRGVGLAFQQTDRLIARLITTLEAWRQRRERELVEAQGRATAPPAPAGPEGIAHALLDEADAKILAIAKGKDQTVDQKMREIARIDRTTLGWKSRRWADLLGVSDAAIRQTDFWAVLRKQHLSPD